MEDAITKCNKWFSDKDSRQVRWCEKYLLKTGNQLRSNESIYDFLINLENNDSRVALDRLDKMKNAWKQIKNRDRAKRKKLKGYSFVMSEGVDQKLEKLAKDEGKTRNKVVEAMIQDNYTFRQEMLDQYKKESDDFKVKNTEKYNSEKNKLEWVSKTIINMQQQIIEEIYYKKIVLDQLLIKLNSLSSVESLTEEEMIQAKNSVKQYIFELNENIISIINRNKTPYAPNALKKAKILGILLNDPSEVNPPT